MPLLGPLVELRNGTAQLIDPTAKRYLLKLADETDNDLCTFFGIRKTEPDQVLAEACMSYLLLDNISNAFYKIIETDFSVFSMATKIKDASPGTPIVLLTYKAILCPRQSKYNGYRQASNSSSLWFIRLRFKVLGFSPINIRP